MAANDAVALRFIELCTMPSSTSISNLLNEVNNRLFGMQSIVHCFSWPLASLPYSHSRPQEKFPCMPLEELFIIEDAGGNGTTWMLWDVWAHKELMSVGSDLHAKFSNLQYLMFAKIVLQRTKDLLFERFTSQTDGWRSITWWLGRVLFLQQRLLDEQSSHLFDMLLVFKQETLSHFGTLKKIEGYLDVNEDSSTVLSMLHIELGIMELFYGREDATRVHFDLAAEVADYNFFVSGALGYRTVHQTVPKVQGRLVRGTKTDADVLFTQESCPSDDSLLQHSNETSEVSDVLMTPRCSKP